MGLRDGGIFLSKIDFSPKNSEVTEENPKNLAYLPSNKQIESLEVKSIFFMQLFYYYLKKNVTIAQGNNKICLIIASTNSSIYYFHGSHGQSTYEILFDKYKNEEAVPYFFFIKKYINLKIKRYENRKYLIQNQRNP